MPIASPGTRPLPPSEPLEQTFKQLTIVGPEYRTSLVDLREVELAALLTHIGGSTVTTTWFSQQVGANDELSAYAPSQLPIYQQYLKINGYEVKLQGSMTTTVDPVTQKAVMTGTLILYPYLRPNTGDAVLIDIGDGQTGQFTVGTVQQKTILKLTCYECEITLARYVTQEISDDFDAKTVKETWYIRDFMTYGQNPIIANEELVALYRIQELEPELLAQWLRLSYSQYVRTTLIPGQATTIYDPYLTKAMFKLYDTNAHPLLARMRILNCDDFELKMYTSLWDVLINQDKLLLPSAFSMAACMSARQFVASRFTNGVCYSSVSQVYVPTNAIPNVDGELGLVPALAGVSLTTSCPCPYTGDPSTSIPVACANGGYVFSQLFYKGQINGLSALEVMVFNYIKGNAIDRTQLFAFCAQAATWGELEQYYFIPILLILLKSANRAL